MAKNNPAAAEIQTSLEGMSYPANSEDLKEHAQQNQASERVMEFLEQIPKDKEYTNPIQVQEDFSAYASDEDELDEAA